MVTASGRAGGGGDGKARGGDGDGAFLPGAMLPIDDDGLGHEAALALRHARRPRLLGRVTEAPTPTRSGGKHPRLIVGGDLDGHIPKESDGRVMVNTFETNRTNTTTSGRVETLRHDRLDYVTDPDLTRPGELLKAAVHTTGRPTHFVGAPRLQCTPSDSFGDDRRGLPR